MKVGLTILAATALLALCPLDTQAQYSLQVIQQFNYRFASWGNQVQFADVDGDGHLDMIAAYQDTGNIGQVIGIWLWQGTKFSDTPCCTINLNFKGKSCWFGVGDVNGDSIADIVMMSQYASYNAPQIVWGRKTWPAIITHADLSCQYPVDADWQSMGQYTSVVVGDFNADGYEDIAFPDQGTSISMGDYGGRMVMYFGGKSMTGQPDMVFKYHGFEPWAIADTSNPDSTNIYLRWYSPFMTKGDFNGDGYEDIFTGAYYSYTDISLTSPFTNKKQQIWNTGAGVVYLGGPNLDTIPDVVMLPSDDFLQFSTQTDFIYTGYRVFNLGNINGDGTDAFSLPSWYWGVCFVYAGMPGLQQAPSEFQMVVDRNQQFYFTKNRYNSLGYADQFGADLIPLGDVNGDGIPDFGNVRNQFGNGPDSAGIRIFLGQKNEAGAIDPDFQTDQYIQLDASNNTLAGKGQSEIVAQDTANYLYLLKFTSPVGVKNSSAIKPTDYRLYQNYPNPFNPTTSIRYYLPTKSKVILSIYNILGERIQTLVNSVQDAGVHNVTLDGSGLASGVYFYSLNAGNGTITKKLALLK